MIEHRLAVNNDAKPVKEVLWKQSKEKLEFRRVLFRSVLTVKDNVGDAVLCYQKLNLAIAATSGDLQGVQEADAVAFSGDDESPGGSTSSSPKPAYFKEDPKMTKKVALTSDGSRSITIGARLSDK